MSKDKTVSFTITMPESLKGSLETMAEEDDRSASAVVRRLIQQEIEYRKNSPKTKTLRPVR